MIVPEVVIDKAGLRRLAGGHPWIWRDQVVSGLDGEPGLVALQAPAGVPRGAAVLGPDSRIALRVVSRDPAFAEAQDDPSRWWIERLDRAIRARAFRLAVGAEACRWVHGEADGLPGLVVDRYGPVAVVQAGCAWADAIAPELAAVLVEQHGVSGVLARHDGAFRRHEGLPETVAVLAGEVPAAVPWRNPGGDGLRLLADPWRGQKTGAFLDQRCNAPWAAQVLPAGRALDAFCHEGAFALALAAAGHDVVAWDGSEPALDRARENAAANGLSGRVAWQRVNVFEALRAAVASGERFDGIVLDPPALAKSRGDLPAARRAYKELNLRALRLLQPGGRLLTCSCSYHLSAPELMEVLREAAADARRDAWVVEVRGAAPDHPRRLAFPEGDYLKVVLLEVTAAG